MLLIVTNGHISKVFKSINLGFIYFRMFFSLLEIKVVYSYHIVIDC